MIYMAKSIERIKAIKLRRKGESIKRIAQILKIAKSTVSLWCQEIKLTKSQIEALHIRMVRGGYKGRLKGALLQKERREIKVKMFIDNG